MAGATYALRALVLRKTKLAESDLIVTLLAEDGRQVRAVAKGARKPSSPFSSRLEIFCEVDLLMASGKNLDIVKEARLVDAHRGLTADMEHAAAAAPMADLAARLCQPGLESPKLFALSSSAFSHAERADAQGAAAVCAAYMLKAFSFAGFRPSLRRCVVCGALLAFDAVTESRVGVKFSVAEGGERSAIHAFCSPTPCAFPQRCFRGPIFCSCRRSMPSPARLRLCGFPSRCCMYASHGRASTSDRGSSRSSSCSFVSGVF